MRKLPPELDNPIENMFIELENYLSEYFRALNLTPNDLTSVSFITGIYSVYLFTQKKYSMSAIFYMISFAFDCFDGNYARKYNMTSRFGDYYDHVSDWIINGAMIFLIAKKYMKLQNNNPKKYVPLALLPLTILMSIHLGCQEKYHNGDFEKNEFLAYSKPMCPTDSKDELEKILRLSRFFGPGTFTLFICLIILLSGSVDKDIEAGK